MQEIVVCMIREGAQVLGWWGLGALASPKVPAAGWGQILGGSRRSVLWLFFHEMFWVRKSESQNLPACQRSQDPWLHGVLRGFPGPVARHAGRRGRLRLQGPDLQRSGREDEEAAS